MLMGAPVTIELTSLLSPEAVERLQEEAERQHVPLTDVVRDALQMYVADLDEPDYEDTPNEEILNDLREAFRDVFAGRTRPIEDLFAELNEELVHNADNNTNNQTV
jgi:hypothetical protein